MSDHIWRAGNGGVLLWEPAREVAITEMAEEQAQPDDQDYAGSHDFMDGELILPSIEDVFISPHLESQPSQDSLMLNSSSFSSSFQERKNSTPISTSHNSPSASGILSDNSLCQDLEESIHIPLGEGSGVFEADSKALCRALRYKSESVNVQLTPCPNRLASRDTNQSLLQSDKGSRRYNKDTTANSSRIRRRLDFEMKSPGFCASPEPRSEDSQSVQRRSKMRSPGNHSTHTPRPKELSNLEALEALRNMERPPPHLWDEDERALLTILYRWYDSNDIWIIPQVFNKITGLNLQLRSIYYQFKSHILLFGGRAYPEFARVMAVPFHDPEKYKDIHQIIEEAAADLGLDLPRRKIEDNFISGMARYAKSPRTRRTYRSLVRRAAEREREKARIAQTRTAQCAPTQPPLTIPKRLLGHKALNLGSGDEAEECFVDTEDLNAQTSPELTKRTVAFRVWDGQSRTDFSEETGFTSQAFTIWRGEHPPPFSLEGQGQQAMMVLTNLHLCLKGGASTFVSLSTSLLQALVKASSMENPRIAVVALDHPILTAPNKTLPAADVLLMLKAEGQAWWARYKGHAERMVWASVPASTIISHFPISDLCDLAEQDPTCAQILNLHEFRRGRRTRYVSNAMRDKQNTITPITAKAMGAIARTFGMHRDAVCLENIQGLIAALVDSFQLAHNSDNDLAHDEENMAYAFAAKLRSRTHSMSEVAQAFRDGVRRGTEIVEYYESRRRWKGKRD